MTREDAKMIADTIGSAIARERDKMRAEMKAAIAEARTNLLAEARAMIAEARTAELERTVDQLLLGSQPPQRLRGASAVVTLPRRAG